MKQVNSIVIQADLEGRIIFKPLGIDEMNSNSTKRKQ